MLAKLSHSDFEDLEDTAFEVDFGEAGMLSATLEKTAGFNLEREEGKREPFSIFPALCHGTRAEPLSSDP